MTPLSSLKDFLTIEDGKYSAAENMDRDLALLHSVSSPMTRTYGWENTSITLGYSQDIEKEIDLKKASKLGVDVAKRPTGGGIAFHHPEDLAFSVSCPLALLPSGIKRSYDIFSQKILKAIRSSGIDAQIKNNISASRTKRSADICFINALDHEITVDGRKLAGMAQRRISGKLLLQGAINVIYITGNVLKLAKNWPDPESYFSSSISVEEASKGKVKSSDLAKAILVEFRDKIR